MGIRVPIEDFVSEVDLIGQGLFFSYSERKNVVLLLCCSQKCIFVYYVIKSVKNGRYGEIH